MRRLEGLVKEIVDEMGYLKKREERFANTNGTAPLLLHCCYRLTDPNSVNEQTSAKLCLVYSCGTRWPWDLADFTSQGLLQA